MEFAADLSSPLTEYMMPKSTANPMKANNTGTRITRVAMAVAPRCRRVERALVSRLRPAPRLIGILVSTRPYKLRLRLLFLFFFLRGILLGDAGQERRHRLR